MKIAILGKGKLKHPLEWYKENSFILWTVGTADYPDCDRYFELHGIQTKHKCDKIEPFVYELARKYRIPVNNSISAMIVNALAIDMVMVGDELENLIIDGCPMNAKAEYEQQKPALALVVGFMRGKGYRITWTDEPENIEYGR